MAGSGRKKADAVLEVAIASGKTMQEAAQAAGIGERTAYRRLEEPEFREEVSRLRNEMSERAIPQLTDASSEAVASLKELLEANSESTRLGAARTILELGVKLRESVELEGRISAL